MYTVVVTTLLYYLALLGQLALSYTLHPSLLVYTSTRSMFSKLGTYMDFFVKIVTAQFEMKTRNKMASFSNSIAAIC